MPPLCLHSNLNEVQNANEPQKEHKQMMFMAISKGAVSKCKKAEKQKETETQDKTQSLEKCVRRNN